MANNSSITFADIEPHLDLLDLTDELSFCTPRFYNSTAKGCYDCEFFNPAANLSCLLRLANPHTHKLADQLRVTHPELFV